MGGQKGGVSYSSDQGGVSDTTEGRWKEQIAQREQQLCLTMLRRVFGQAVCLIVRQLQSQH